MRKLFILIGILLSVNVNAELKMAKIFSDNMVLQRDIHLPVWGWTAAGEKITVRFKGQEKTAIADADGKWMLRLDPLKASLELEKMTIMGHNENKEFCNILVGDVWLCSGQSNMEVSFSEIPDEAQGVKDPQLRLIGKIDSGWQICNTGNLMSFSRVAYYFGAKLRNELGVPIGLINMSRGCSSIETWMTPESFETNNFLIDANGCKLLAEMEKFQKFHSNYKQCSSEEKARVLFEHCKGNYSFARSYLENGKLNIDKYDSVLKHMTVIKPAFLYNSLIAPIIPFGIKGVIWYQGETNVNDRQYAQKQQILVESWRKVWNQLNFPFYIVQLAPSNGARHDIWIEQYKAVSEIANSGIITTVDIGGDCIGVHPKNKRDVGLRLALLALRDTYGRKDVIASGPSFKAIKTDGVKVIIEFENIGTGMMTKDGLPPNSFEIAEADKKFLKADTLLEGNTVIVSNSSLKSPMYVRYAWNSANNCPNLQNKEGLPAFPFNTAEPFFQRIK